MTMPATASITAYAPAPGFRLDDRTALITGAGGGTGLSIAIEFARAGAEVVLVARTRDHLEVAATATANSAAVRMFAPATSRIQPPAKSSTFS